jgi:hypothetical protein
MANRLTCVLTTIQEPTACVRRLAARLQRVGAGLIVVGDRKGPACFDLPGARFWPLLEQRRLPFRLARLLPEGHYTRKNLGYLLALREGAACMYETDDDNRPGPTWKPRRLRVAAQPASPRPWLNVYRAFTHQHVWPRGFPLEQLQNPETTVPATSAEDGDAAPVTVTAPIQQGLADLAPDVDAVWRLVFGQEVWFEAGPSLLLPPGTWCPFNSQSTWWWPVAYPLLYLPSFCSFRMTDIWRSFVAQRCLWALGHGLVFHGPEAIQERNPHRLLGDLADETAGYLNNQKIVDCLAGLELASGAAAVADNLRRCYEALIGAGVLPARERPLVDAWIDDVRGLRPDSAGGREAKVGHEERTAESYADAGSPAPASDGHRDGGGNRRHGLEDGVVRRPRARRAALG